jgi:hypothetical protein
MHGSSDPKGMPHKQPTMHAPNQIQRLRGGGALPIEKCRLLVAFSLSNITTVHHAWTEKKGSTKIQLPVSWGDSD